MTQEQLIKEHLEKFGKITTWEAFEDYGVTRLSSIIFNLRKNMYIDSKMKTTKNRLGHMVKYSEYTLVQEEEDASEG